MLSALPISGSGQALVSLVSVWVRNSLLLCERVEGVAKGEIVEITNVHDVHAGAVHIVEMIVG